MSRRRGATGSKARTDR